MPGFLDKAPWNRGSGAGGARQVGGPREEADVWAARGLPGVSAGPGLQPCMCVHPLKCRHT